MSIVFFIAVVGASGAMVAIGVDSAWVPLGAMAVGNALSLTLGLMMARNPAQIEVAGDYRIRHLAKSGRWLVANALTPRTTNLVAAAIVSALAGSEALGYAEGARVAAQPIMVFSLGVAAVISPRAMEAARTRARSEARRLSRAFDLTMVVGGLTFLGLFGFDWRLNVLADLVPNAYVVGGLTAVTIIANTVNATAQPLRAELIASNRSRNMAMVEFLSSPALLLVAVTASTTEAFAIPLGLLLGGLIRVAELHRRANQIYTGHDRHADLPPESEETL